MGAIAPREIALDVLMYLEKDEKALCHIILRQTLDKYDYLKKEDKAFIQILTEGTIERKLTLDYALNQFSKTDTQHMKPFIRSLLRMSTYQILYMDKVPDSAAIDEAVKSCKKHSFQNLSGFVNGVLRSLSAGKDTIKWPGRNNPQYLSVTYSVPQELCHKFSLWHGKKESEQMLKASLVKQVVLRVPKAHEAEFLTKNGTYVERHPYADHAYVLKQDVSLRDLTGFSEGLFTVQDISSILAVNAAGIQNGDTVMDCCAAPGGKSCYALELAGEGCVYSFDISENKLPLIEQGAVRLHLDVSRLKIGAMDASVFDPTFSERMDVVIADLPCSGLGVLSKKSDIKYHCTEDSMASLVTIQKAILDNVARYVKKGGTLLFSTCTVNPEENVKQFEAFLETHPAFRACDLSPYISEGLKASLTERDALSIKEGYLQLRQGIYQSDGFFISKCERVQ